MRPPVAAGINSLTVDSFAIISFSQFLCLISVKVPFSFRLLDLFPYRLLESVFRCQASSTLTVLRAASRDFRDISAMPPVLK